MKKSVILALAASALFFTAEARETSRAAADGAASNVYGYCYEADLSDMEFMPGIFSISPEFKQRDWDPIFLEQGLQAYDGWYHDGKVSGIVSVMHTGTIAFYFKYSYDFATDEVLDYQEFFEIIDDMFYAPFIETGVYFFMSRLNPVDNLVYGYAYNLHDSGNIYWAKADLNDLNNAQAVKLVNDDVCYSLCYNDTEGSYYGVNVKHQFVKIDLDGNQTVIADLPAEKLDLSAKMSGLAWNPAEGRYYWNNLDNNANSKIYTITPEGEVELYKDVYTMEYFTFMFCAEGDSAVDSGIEGVADSNDNISVAAADNSIRISGAQGCDYSIVTLDGINAGAGSVESDEMLVSAAPGMYIVTVGSKIAKIIVR